MRLPSVFLCAIVLALAAGLFAEPACAQSGCPVAAVTAYQPVRYTMRNTFYQAATNALGSNGPSYNQINYSDPIQKVNVSASRPIPNVLMKAAAFQESNWRQFNCTGVENCSGPTLISYDCGYGVMQITSCMTGGCGWTPSRVASEIPYNIGVGAVFFISKWNGDPYWLGDNDHTEPEQWYFVLMAYNGRAEINNPNNTSYDPHRPPHGEGNYTSFGYSYQERVLGFAANPQRATAGTQWLWRPTNIADVPRGIFGIDPANGWLPPNQTTRPLVHLFRDINISGGSGPSLVVANTTGMPLALDIVLYNNDGSYRTRWLDPSSTPPFVVPYIRLAPYASRTIPLANAFPGQSFSGYARIDASEGITISMQSLSLGGTPVLGDPADDIYMPIVFKDYGCTERLVNGGFESITFGKPGGWQASSAEGYFLADSTWFRSGHFGAYLGGYDNAADTLYQQVAVPSGGGTLNFYWYKDTTDTSGAAVDTLTLRIRDLSGNLLASPWAISNLNAERVWQLASISLAPYAGQVVRISFEAVNNASLPTQFFIDDASLIGCGS